MRSTWRAARGGRGTRPTSEPLPSWAADLRVTTDFQAARRHCYGTTAAEPPPASAPTRPANRWLTLPALDRLVSYDSAAPCAAPCTPPPIV
ncbi:hypothetical protein [Streptomyces sp. NPDC048665]|uniref:hypothetical protein n=1 Tax=Streptomyces sp. NPDC048665 TaxID=3155490 RepID=UPI003421F9E6